MQKGVFIQPTKESLSHVIKFSELNFNLDNEAQYSAWNDLSFATFKEEKVAVKTLSEKQTAATEDQINRFKKEIHLVCTFSHQNIVQIYGVCYDEDDLDTLAIVMEKMDGNLCSFLTSKPNLSWQTKVDIALDVARGLRFLHASHIMHRDLTSKSIFYTKRGGFKIGDFGVAKTVSDPISAPASQPQGTAAWLAPELFQKTPQYSTMADIYSFGVVLWECATQKVPSVRNPNATTDIEGSVQREEIPEDVKEEIAKLIRWCWMRAPAARPTVGQVIYHLEDIVNRAPWYNA